MKRWTIWLVMALLAGLAAGCGAIGSAEVAEARVLGLPLEESKPEPGGAPATELGAESTKALESSFEACPVTLPGEEVFTPSPPYAPVAPYGERFWYGSESLWTSLPGDGRWAQLAHGDKVFWWRVGYTPSEAPQPQLWMTARRLDGEGSVEQEPPATNAYHPDFHWAMLTGFAVPAGGCWEITGHYEGEGGLETVTFVVWVESGD